MSNQETTSIFDQIAKCVIPTGTEWHGYAQTFAAAIFKHAWNNELAKAEVFRLIAADHDELRAIFAGTPAEQFTENGNEKMFSAVRAIVCQYIQQPRN